MGSPTLLNLYCEICEICSLFVTKIFFKNVSLFFLQLMGKNFGLSPRREKHACWAVAAELLTSQGQKFPPNITIPGELRGWASLFNGNVVCVWSMEKLFMGWSEHIMLYICSTWLLYFLNLSFPARALRWLMVWVYLGIQPTLPDSACCYHANIKVMTFSSVWAS